MFFGFRETRVVGVPFSLYISKTLPLCSELLQKNLMFTERSFGFDFLQFRGG
jgi:hypothetical protein